MSERLVIFLNFERLPIDSERLVVSYSERHFSHQKDLDVKERHEFSSERHEFLFSERLVVVIFFGKTCNFFQKDF